MKLNEIKNDNQIIKIADFYKDNYLNVSSELNKLIKENPNARFEVDGDISLNGLELEVLPVKFEVCEGIMTIANNNLFSLKGCPQRVYENFSCHNNILTSLKYGPEIVGGIYRCADNRLTSFEGVPKDLEALGIQDNKITSLVGIHNHIKSCRKLNINRNPIVEGGIGLLLIEHLTEKTFHADDLSGTPGISDQQSSDFFNAMAIISKYLGTGKAGLLECQEELENAGLEAFAKL